MPLPLALLPLAVARTLSVSADGPTRDGATGAVLAALAPVWPALTPWLAAGLVALTIGVATEVLVRELRRRGGVRQGATPPTR